MKKNKLTLFIQSVFIFLALSLANKAISQNKGLMEDSKEGVKEFTHTDVLMKSLFDNAYGYVVFPNVGKGAIGVGGAAGNGIVYKKATAVGTAKMTQVSVGFQFGGQAYREVIFFENKETFDKFKKNKIQFAAQASAVAAKAGASTNVKYSNGVLIFTEEKGGLMYEASIGGQKFKYTAF